MQEEVRSVSLITYNIHKGFGLGAVRFLLPKMREAITSLNPDFVFLQEVQGEHVKRQKRINAWPDSPNLNILLKTYGRIMCMQKMLCMNLGIMEMLF